jgi:hypothetical protein
MPEITVDKYGDMGTVKGEIRTSWKFLYVLLEFTIAGTQQRANISFGRSSFATNSAHQAAPFLN